MIPQLEIPDLPTVLDELLVVYLLACALPSWFIHEYCGWRWWWDRK
jgi:hypothetical protein